jgi:hypothetical protein
MRNRKRHVYEDEEDKDIDEISLSLKDPEDYTPQEPGSDFVGPDAYGDQPSDYTGWTSESKNTRNVMKLSREQFREILSEEINYLFEDCGCGGGHMTYMHDDEPEYGSVSIDDPGEDLLLDREEALSLVSIIAARTSCPVTKQALLDVVDSLSDDVSDFDLGAYDSPSMSHESPCFSDGEHEIGLMDVI